MEHGDANPDEMMSGGWRIFTCNLKHAHIVTIKMRQIMCNNFPCYFGCEWTVRIQ